MSDQHSLRTLAVIGSSPTVAAPLLNAAAALISEIWECLTQVSVQLLDAQLDLLAVETDIVSQSESSSISAVASSRLCARASASPSQNEHAKNAFF